MIDRLWGVWDVVTFHIPVSQYLLFTLLCLTPFILGLVGLLTATAIVGGRVRSSTRTPSSTATTAGSVNCS